MIFFEYEQVVKIHSALISKTGGMDLEHETLELR